MLHTAGWVKLHRKLLEWEWYSDTNATRLFLHFLLIANHENKRFKGKVIARGQLLCGREELAKKLGMSVQSIRTALDKLKSTSEITSVSTSEGTLITITNYDNYQDSNQQINHEATSNQPAINQQSTIYKEDKKIRTKEDKKEIGGSHPTPTKGTRLQVSELPPCWKNYCLEKRSDLDPEKVFEDFRDYWIAIAGSKGVKVNWDATWQRWVRNTFTQKGGENGTHQHGAGKIYGKTQTQDEIWKGVI